VSVRLGRCKTCAREHDDFTMPNPIRRSRVLLLFGVWLLPGLVFGQGASIQGRITDPQGNGVARADVTFSSAVAGGKEVGRAVSDGDGWYLLNGLAIGNYTLKVRVIGFESVVRSVLVKDGERLTVDVALKIRSDQQTVRVTADAKEANVLAPDPAQRVVIREETLDANPGRPGVPVSIPGVPIETASGGIKAPQYFAPGVAGDHGEPIAQYVAVGSYLLSNNLSANAHGNGYADPNILVPSVIESVQTDGGAFNVREGNHAENLAATYELRSRLEPFATLTGDYRDLDLVTGWSPASGNSWITLQASYGNGFLDRLEHRQQYKFNAYRIVHPGVHDLTFLAIGYYGTSDIPGLTPIGVSHLHDTIDPRQKDRTHTGLVAANDVWRLTRRQQFLLSGFFRTYDLALYSNFGEGLIRQSEFRTVTGSNATYTNKFAEFLTLLAGADYQRDAPRRLDLDRYISDDPSVYGPFQRVTANNLTIGDIAPYIALDGVLTKRFRYYLGFRRDEIAFDNTDLLVAAHSFNQWIGVNSPKATLSFLPSEHSLLPFVSVSAGQAFFTNDPRIGSGTTEGTPVSRAHSYQLVASKPLAGTEIRLTLGHVTTEASLAKIDPDTGLQSDEGPGRLRFLTVSARRYFPGAMLQASFSKADARDLSSGEPTPEAPRTILGVVGTTEKLPFHLQGRTEFEYVGAKPLGDGFTGGAVKELRIALLRPLAGGRVSLGMNLFIGSGYTGQTTEVLALSDESAPFERVVGVRLPSYVSLSCTYHFRRRPGP
jgi:Carboxypeptidase regulatory-like domain